MSEDNKNIFIEVHRNLNREQKYICKWCGLSFRLKMSCDSHERNCNLYGLNKDGESK